MGLNWALVCAGFRNLEAELARVIMNYSGEERYIVFKEAISLARELFEDGKDNE